MKIIIERGVLLKSLAHVQSVVERRNTIPILSNVKLTAVDGVLDLNTTDLDLDITEKVPGQVDQPGASTAPAHTLYDIVRKLPDGAQVELDSTGSEETLHLRAGRSKFSLATRAVDGFPVLSSTGLDTEFVITADDLKSVIDRTKFAISREETRYYLNGIYFHAAERDEVPVLRAVSTDGHRLASVEVPLPEGAAEMPGVIIPQKTITQLRKLIDESEGDIFIALSEAKIKFSFDGVVLTSKLIDGTFPDYQRVIPTQNDKFMDLDCSALAEAADRVSAISSERSRAVKMDLSPGSLVLSANSPESGSAQEDLEVAYDGPAMTIGFNAQYLSEILTQVTGDTVRFALNDSSSPVLVRDLADSSAVYVLMPMRV